MKISSLSLENFRCFEKLEIDFNEQLTVIVGVNGSGKTAILEAVGFFLTVYAENFSMEVNGFPNGHVISFIKKGEVFTYAVSSSKCNTQSLGIGVF